MLKVQLVGQKPAACEHWIYFILDLLFKYKVHSSLGKNVFRYISVPCEEMKIKV